MFLAFQDAPEQKGENHMKIVSHSLYKGIFPEENDDVIFLSNEEMLAHPEILAEAEVLNIHPYMLTKDFLDLCKQVKWIQTPAAGVDGTDLAEMKRRNILFTNGSGNMSISIAEDAFCKMLLFSRRVREYDAAKSRKEWITFGQDPWMSVVSKDLYTKKLGLIGDGAIASEIAKRAKAFDMEVLTYGLYNRDCPYWDHFYTDSAGLDTVLSQSDYVIVVVPLTKNTYHMINADAFNKMKKEAIFLNAARGPIVDQEALIQALESGSIAAAALDVFEVEPLPPDSRLWDLPNVFITTHKAGAGDSWVRRLAQLYADNLALYRSGQPLRNLVRL